MSTGEIEKIKIKDLVSGIKKLSLKSVFFILIPLFALLETAYQIGRWSNSPPNRTYSEVSVNKEVSVDKEFNELQKDIRNSPPIKVFESNRNALTNENWVDAYSTFSSNMKNYLAPNGPDFLKYHYRMLNRYKSNIFIPINTSESKVEYLVYWEYSDIRPVLSEFESLITRPIIDVLSEECILKLKKDILLELPKHYIVKDTGMVTTYINNCFQVLRYRDLISRRYGLIDEIGRKNNLEPIYVKPLSQGDYEDSDCEACSRLVLIKEGDDWKVDQFTTILISRKNE